MFAKLLKRAKEPSTWVALGVLGHLFGVSELVALGVPETATAVASTVAIAAGVFLPEAGNAGD